MYAALAAGFLLAVFVLFYAPALKLGYSLLDEALYLNNLDEVWANWWRDGLLSALRRDVFTVNRALKPGAPMLYAAAYSLVGENRMLMHALLLLLLAVTVAGLAVTPWLDMRRQEPLPIIAGGAALGGVTAAFLLLGAEVPGWSGVQALRANWYRLHTSEAPISACLAVHTALLVLGLTTGSPRRRTLLILSSMLFLLFGGTLKLTAYAHLGPPVVLALLLAAVRHPAWKPLAIAAGGSVALSLLYTAFLKAITPTGGTTYFTAYSLDPGQMVTSGRFFLSSFHEMMGPLFVLLLPAVAARVICEWDKAQGWRAALDRNLLLIYCLLGWSASVTASLPWPHLIPRYLLPAHTLLCLAIGLEVAMQSQWLFSMPEKRRRALPALAGAAAILVLKVALMIPALLGLSVFARLRRRESWVQGALLGIFTVSLVWFAVFAWFSRGAFLRDYVNRERVDGQLAQVMIDQFVAKPQLGFLGDAQDERIGSLAIFARRDRGASPTVRSVKEAKDLAGLDLLLVEEQLGQPVQAPFGLPALARFRGNQTVVRPISFWHWRGELWKGHLSRPAVAGALPAGWTLYAVP